MGFRSFIRGVRDRLQRLRHFRGHGVHSPYIYSIVREVFMRRMLYSGVDAMLLLELADLSVDISMSRRTLVELHNLFIHCGYKSFGVDPESMTGLDYAIVTRNTNSTIEQARVSGTTVVLFGCSRSSIASLKLSESHSSTSLDRGQYVVIFNNHLPKQHYIL